MMKNLFRKFFAPNPNKFCFRKFIFSPDKSAKKSSSLRIPSNDSGDPSENRVVSSAYCESLYPSPSISIPLISLLFLIRIPKTSAHKRKKIW